MSGENTNFIDVVSERIKFDLDKLESNELQKIEVDSFNLADFWAQFGAAVQGLSNEVTKIGFACGQQPYPTSGVMVAMLQDLMQCYSVMRDLYLVLPEEVGATVYNAVTSAVVDIVAALLAIVRSLSDPSKKGAKERLKLTGTFWEACAAVETLPRNNLLATLGVIDEEIGMAVDAQEELTTAIEEDRQGRSELGDIDNSDLWTNAERDLATKAVGLVKVAQVCLQKVRKAVDDCGSCSSPQNCAELDATATASRTISPALDDFVSELYHPVDVPTALENTSKPDTKSTVQDSNKGGQRPNRARRRKPFKVPLHLRERLAEMDARGWSRKDLRNKRWLVTREDGSTFRIRGAKLKKLTYIY